MPPRLTVIGGTGFVGTRVVKAALAQGLQVTSVSRSGKLLREDPALAGAEFVAADVEDEASLRTVLDGADSVVSCLGAFGSQDFMRRINGDANASIAKHARAVGVKRMVYVSAQPFRPIEGLLHGYFGGKRAAEEAVAEHFGSDGAILRPPAVYGTRAVSATASVPLGALGVPLTTFLETGPMRGVASALGPLGDFLTPWVSVDDVAHAAVAHVVADAPAADGVATEPSSAPAAAAAAYNDQLRLQRPAGEPLMLRWTEIREAAQRLRTAMPPEVTLFWDGGCPLCRREIEHYMKIDVEKKIDWVDIDADPAPLQPHGVSQAEAVALIHAVDKQGALQVGIPAFLAIWDELPAPWSMLPPLVRNVPGASPAAAAAYSLWAKHRLRITGRKLGEGSACEK